MQGNLSIRRGITRYQQASAHPRQLDGNNVMSSRNESQQLSQQTQLSQQAGVVKLIGKNSLHMKRRSEFPQDSSSSNQWHLPDPSGNQVITASESQKSTGISGFNFQKIPQQPSSATAAWVPQQQQMTQERQSSSTNN